jgi:uncharacterized protein (DUF4415 family)
MHGQGVVEFEWDPSKDAGNLREHGVRFAVRQKTQMKRQYDFSKARRGPVVPATPGKTRITIRLDNDVIEHFQALVDRAGGGNYQTLINDALREYIRGARLEKVVRRAVREEVKAVSEALTRTA